MKNVTKNALGYSIGIHVIAIMFLMGFIPGCGKGMGMSDAGDIHASKQDTGVEAKKDKIVPKAKLQAQNDTVDVTFVKGGNIKPAKPRPTKECPGKWFAGVGMQWDPFSLAVDQVYDGYPAKAAGIQIGDILLQPMLRGEPSDLGKHITVKINRNGELLLFDIVREKICIEDIVVKQK